jgi:hypothetical protein
MGLDTIFVKISDGAVEFPSQLLGTVYAVVTDSGNSTEDENIVVGPAILLPNVDSQDGYTSGKCRISAFLSLVFLPVSF